MDHHEIFTIRSICLRNGFHVRDVQLSLISSFVDMLLDWNTKINLISRRDEENIWTNHILHSISILFKLSFAAGARILDLGTGGGLPGIPLAILLPESNFLLVDATQKKTKAIEDMIGRLGLRNVTTQWGRAEELSKRPSMSGAFDVVVARGVASLEDIVEYGWRFLRPVVHEEASPVDPRTDSRTRYRIKGGHLIVYKGGDTSSEVAVATRRREVERIQEVPLTFEGSAESGLVDKKIILIQMKN